MPMSQCFMLFHGVSQPGRVGQLNGAFARLASASCCKGKVSFRALLLHELTGLAGATMGRSLSLS